MVLQVYLIMQNTVSSIFLLFYQHMNFTLGVYLYIASIYCQDIKFIVGKWIQMKQLGGSIGVYSYSVPSLLAFFFFFTSFAH